MWMRIGRRNFAAAIKHGGPDPWGWGAEGIGAVYSLVGGARPYRITK
jgi:hypothetical protein